MYLTGSDVHEDVNEPDFEKANGSKLLKGRIFYLSFDDDNLIIVLKELGGQISTVLEQTVTHVITRNLKTKKIINFPNVYTRGCYALQKSLNNNPYQTVFEKAKRLGCKLADLQTFVMKLREITEIRRNQTEKLIVKAYIQGRLRRTAYGWVVSLKEPFIKVEDQSEKYKPLWCELDSWPEITYDDKDAVFRANNCKTARKSFKRKDRDFCEHWNEYFSGNTNDHCKTEKHKSIVTAPGYWDAVDYSLNKLPSVQDLCRRMALKQ